MILPKNYFNDPAYANINEGNGVASFQNLQKEYEDGTNFFGVFYNLLPILLILIAIILVFIYSNMEENLKSHIKEFMNMNLLLKNLRPL